MPSAEHRRLAAALAATLAAVGGLGGCGTEVPHGGVVKTAADAETPDEPKERRPPQPHDLIPGDLDVVIRVDLSKVRDSLGGETSELLLERAAETAHAQGLVRRALANAEVVWLGLRMADVEQGDRVMVVRSVKQRGEQDPIVAPDPIAWTKEPTDIGAITRYLAKTTPGRDDTERIFTFDERTAVFVTPVESYSVERVLKRGPDADRGQPAARGLVSLDYRTGKLSAAHENAYPSLAALVSGMVRMRATVEVIADQLELEGRIRCKTNTAAAKIQRFLETIVAAASRRPRDAALLKDLTITRSETVVSIAWPIPRALIAALLVDSSPRPAPRSEPKPGPPSPTTPTPEPPAPTTGPSEPPAPTSEPPTPSPSPDDEDDGSFDFTHPVELPPRPKAPPPRGG